MPDVKRHLTRVGNRDAVWLYGVLDERVSSGRRGVHVLVITTSGRLTGVQHSTCVRYLDTPGGFVVWGTGSGSPRDPDWFNPTAIWLRRVSPRPVDNHDPSLSERRTLPSMSRDQTNDDFFVDANGCLAERVNLDGQEVIVHYDDIPESDITCVNGIRITTALRTVIDLAPELGKTELEQIVRECLDRRLFTPEEVAERVARPDMWTRPGAKLLRQVVSDLSGTT